MLVMTRGEKRLLHARQRLDLHHDPQHRAVPADLRFWNTFTVTVILWHVDVSLFDAVTFDAT